MHIMDSKKPLYKSISFWIMVLFLLYSALGFLAVPYYLKKQFIQVAESQLNSQVSVNAISFNPYTIAIDISGLCLTDLSDTKIQWFKAEKVQVNLDLWKTLFSYVSLSKIHLENPQYSLVLEHHSNGIQLKYPKLANINHSVEKQPLQLDIDNLSINKGSIQYTDALASTTLNLNFTDIQFNQKAFTTRDKDEPFDLSFTTEADHKTKISGHYNLSQISLKANWTVKNWSTVTLLKLAGELDHEILGINNHSGNIAAQGQINYSQTKPVHSEISIEKLFLTEFSSTATTKESLDLKIPEFTLNYADIDLNQRGITVESIQTKNNRITIMLNENNELLWDVPIISTNDKTETAWQFSLKKLTLQDSDFIITKSKQHNTLHITQLQGTDMSSIKEHQSEFNFTGVIDKSAQLSANSQLHFSPFTLTTDLQLDDLNLKDWQAWIPSNLHIKMDDGLFSTQQHITINKTNTQSQGSSQLNNAVFLDDTNHEFFAIDQLLIDKNTIDFNKKSLALDNIILNHAQGDLLITEEKELNLNSIIHSESENTKPSKKLENNHENSDWKITINRIELNDGQTSITDKSITPNYHSQFSRVKGCIKGLSSQNLSKADGQLSVNRVLYIQSQFIDQLAVPKEKGFIQSSESSETLYPQVQFGIAGL